MLKYKIADLTVEITGIVHQTVLDKCEPYRCDDSLTSDVKINIQYSDIKFTPDDPDNTYGSGEEFWCQNGDHLYEYLLSDNNGEFIIKIDYYNSGKNVDVYLYDVKKNNGYDDTHYLSNTISILFHYVAIANNRIVLHSSSVYADGYGVAFSADSGVGKSTHTSLWMKYVPGCEYLNDDTPIIYKKDGGIYIYGTPFAGSTGINNNVCVPLKAITFIKRGINNSIRRLSTAESLEMLMGQLVQPLAGDYLDNMLGVLSDILSEVPVYELKCNMEFDAVKTSYECIYGKTLEFRENN